ncbi:hypothetical protein V6N13_065068 [Hibiscus sabdariffa]
MNYSNNLASEPVNDTGPNRCFRYVNVEAKQFVIRIVMGMVPNAVFETDSKKSYSISVSTTIERRNRQPMLELIMPGLAAEGPSTEPYTPMPLVFSHASSSQFQSPMAPPTEGFFAGAFSHIVR